MIRPELLAPAGCMEGVRAAVQNGADAVYMGFGAFNARRGAKNFTKEEMEQAIAYCRVRGVKTHITFNILSLDRERKAALSDAHFLQQAGADALIVQDLGLARLLRWHAPDLALHASTQMTIHTVEGARLARELGFTRVVLARECTLTQIAQISAEAGVETEVFVHGALCMCYSGQCYLSSVIGQRSGNRGLCAQPCRLAYSYGDSKKGYPLSLKDLSLAHWLDRLAKAGVASLKIEGRMKRPEYAAIVTKIYSDLLREGRAPNNQELLSLQKVFSRDGFTDGYVSGHKGDGMFGIKTEIPLHEVKSLYQKAAHTFEEGKEEKRVPVDMAFVALYNEPMVLAASDGVYTVRSLGPKPEPAKTHETTDVEVSERLKKTGGTPFFMEKLAVTLDKGIALSASQLNRMRREVLDALLSRRAQAPKRIWRDEIPCDPVGKPLPFQGYTIEVRTLEQAEAVLAEMEPQTLYAPLMILAEDLARTADLASCVPIAAVLPRVYSDKERPEILRMLKAVHAAGVSTALAGNLGQLLLLRSLGFCIYGDFGLNATNSDALATLLQVGIQRQTLSFELRLEQIKSLSKPMETELLVYGHLPFMLFENCIIRRKASKCTCEAGPCTLKDRTGRRFHVIPEYGCRNVLLNCQPLYLPKEKDYSNLGVAFARLRFTIESPARCAAITHAISNGKMLEFSEGATRGLYFRGVT